MFLHECGSLALSSTVITATLMAILNEMEGGGHGFNPSGEYDNECGKGWECVIIAAATNCVDAIPDYLQWPGQLEREVVVHPPDQGKRLELLRDMLLGPLMASGPHDDDKPVMDNDNDELKNLTTRRDCGRSPTRASATQQLTCVHWSRGLQPLDQGGSGAGGQLRRLLSLTPLYKRGGPEVGHGICWCILPA